MELLKNLEGMSADEQMTAVVELQKAAMKHLEEQKQASIGKSAELVIQGLKKIKADFEAKFDSLNSDIQAKVANLKDGQQGLQGEKGERGDRGLDGANGRDGRDGKDGRDGQDGVDGVGVRDAKIDFDGSLVISLTDGREINCGEVVSVDVAKQIQKVTHNIQTGSGGDSQTVLDAIAALQATIATYGTMATQNANNVAITGGNINGTTIGGTTPAAGTFTTLTATGQTSLGGAAGAEGLRVLTTASAVNYLTASGSTSGSAVTLGAAGLNGGIATIVQSKGSGTVEFWTNGGNQRQAVVAHTASAVNYVQVTGAVTTAAPVISAQGSDSNIGITVQGKGTGAAILQASSTGNALLATDGGLTAIRAIPRATSGDTWLDVQRSVAGVALSAASGVTNGAMIFQSKGTGAIDLAAGSSGVNISNGGTVTAITRTATNSNYTSAPTVAISAPTTAGGVQATVSCTIGMTLFPINGGGTGYTVGDLLTISGGTFTTAAQVQVSAVSGGVITAVTGVNTGVYTVAPSNPASVTGGTGTGATFNCSFAVNTTFNITNAGSGYVEQPTVSFSGGGGSGAAAYATVGGNTSVTGLGSNINFFTAGGYQQFQISNNAGATTGYFSVNGASQSGQLFSVGTGNGVIGTSSTGALRFTTSYTLEQFRVSHTASAVNYVQVTGSATGGAPIISAQGSDTNAALILTSKGTSAIVMRSANSGATQFRVDGTNAAINYLQAAGTVTGVAPILSAQGNDTNIDLALTPKGTGSVVANAPVKLQGYTVATLPTAGTIGRTAYVTDALTPTYLGALVGGGAVKTPVFDNGTAWVSY